MTMTTTTTARKRGRRTKKKVVKAVTTTTTNAKGRTKNRVVDEGKLNQAYYDVKNVASFGGKRRLKETFFHGDVDKWAPKQLTYTVHKPIRRRFPTRRYRTAGINRLWQLDMLEMIPYASINDGYRYILTCVDVFSRFARALPTKSKTGVEVAGKIGEMFETNVPYSIQTDKGKEFYNSQVEKVLKKYGVKLYTVNSQFKASIVERFNRTLREKLNRYFTHSGKKRWVDILPNIISTYNKTKHIGIFNRTPESITEETEFDLWMEKHRQDENSEWRKRDEKMLEPLSYVRISKISASNPFNKNFDQNWSDEVFRIVGVDTKAYPAMYIIEDEGQNVIQGKFYKSELQIIPEKPKIYRIEKIIKSRGTGKHKQHFVKWSGYPETYNSWISAAQLQETV